MLSHFSHVQLCSPPGSSVHRILQARILDWVVMPSSRGLFPTRGLNQPLLYVLHWQVGSLSLLPPGEPQFKDPKRRLLLGRKVMTNLDSILKSRDITLPTKVHLGKAMVFPVVMYGCESWTVKKAERRRIDAFELWCWRRLLRFLRTARRSNQSILKEISPECSLEELILKLKL